MVESKGGDFEVVDGIRLVAHPLCLIHRSTRRKHYGRPVRVDEVERGSVKFQLLGRKEKAEEKF